MSNKIGRKIKPSKILINYLKETLEIERLKAKGIIELDDENLKLIRNNDEMKVRTLDKLFGSMAELIYFFEYINKNPQLIDKFGSDIEDLLGLKFYGYNVSTNHDTFRRLIEAILGYRFKDRKKSMEDPRFNYQRRLLAIMQASVNRATWGYFIEDKGLRGWAHEGLMRAQFATRSIDKPTLHQNKKPRRVLGF